MYSNVLYIKSDDNVDTVAKFGRCILTTPPLSFPGDEGYVELTRSQDGKLLLKPATPPNTGLLLKVGKL